ncbi:MAG: VWA domain-containing protein [Acidobacteria bacterium]|nr:VWA domain-containing protein [Acidobacteriota bacterium]
MHGRFLVRLLAAAVLAALTTFVAWPTQEVRAQAGARERTIFVSAVDPRGEPVNGLDLDDFTITEDGQSREVLRVSRADEPMDIVLLADNSAEAERLVGPMRDALRDFVRRMAEDNQMALIALADRPTILVNYTSNQMRLEEGIGRLFSMSGSGMTLLDSLVEVSAGLRQRDTRRAVIVPVITTGVEFTNRYGLDVVDTVKQAGAAIHAFVIGQPDFGTVPGRERAVVLDAGTRETGGQHVTLLTESAVKPALQKLARQLSSQYKVLYSRPDSLIPPENTDVTSRQSYVTARGTPARGQGD